MEIQTVDLSQCWAPAGAISLDLLQDRGGKQQNQAVCWTTMFTFNQLHEVSTCQLTVDLQVSLCKECPMNTAEVGATNPQNDKSPRLEFLKLNHKAPQVKLK